jgi:hypothetical protein
VFRSDPIIPAVLHDFDRCFVKGRQRNADVSDNRRQPDRRISNQGCFPTRVDLSTLQTVAPSIHADDGLTLTHARPQEFVEEYNRKRGAEADARLDAMALCARTDSEVVVGAYDKVASKFKNNDDIWLVPIDIAIKGILPSSSSS